MVVFKKALPLAMKERKYQKFEISDNLGQVSYCGARRLKG